jgi:hypothetical protein
MSKRTTQSKTTAETATPRRRAAKPAAEVPAAAPRAPRTRRKTSTTEVSAAAEAAQIDGRAPSHDEIATRAYFISLESGADPVNAWLIAERELLSA